ncbi:MAG: hypothetical protein JO127_13060 [Caulobacteraceae bacterium]|nr:hypothetical protein [Caulobacteraceae bacterium]
MHNLFDLTGRRAVPATTASPRPLGDETLIGPRMAGGMGGPPHLKADEGRQAKQTGAVT